ncbi:MAG: alpha/beta hydrolase [Acidobacteriia bacterium]|nr:alpha/beta hydrolase [Terriglobia bacterium]
MRRIAVVLLPALAFAAGPLDTSRLEAIHAQRVEWMKKRVVYPPQGVYRDLRAVPLGDTPVSSAILKAAKSAEVQVLLRPSAAASELRDGIVIVKAKSDLPVITGTDVSRFGDAKEDKAIQEKFKAYPDETLGLAGKISGAPPEVVFRHASTHILALSPTPGAVEASMEQGRAYAAADWLCDPAGFSFVAENNFGAYDIGDTVPMMGGTNLVVNLPVAADISLIRDNTVVAHKVDSRLVHPVTEMGSYRAVVVLKIDGGDAPWIMTNPIQIGKPNFTMPMTRMSPDVEVKKDIAYVDDGLAKHKLDLYLPKGAKNFPVMVFFHGGSWKTGDRSQYPPFGNRFAKAGMGVVVPSYRLMPQNPHPAQIEDAAAAFAWVYKNIAQFGGDVSRIYIAGHSAGGHLAALLALDPEWLKKYDISPGAIRGVASMSGVYEVDDLGPFKDKKASPMEYIHPRMPPFLISYCQWDYVGLPKQARDFNMALKKEFGDVKLLYVAGESHISEIIATLKDDDPLARALIEFIR